MEAVVQMKQEWLWVDNCCSWERDSWVGLSYCSLLFHTGLIFSVTTKKKLFSKSRWVPFPTERRTRLKWRRQLVTGKEQPTAASAGAPHSSLSWGLGVWSEMRLGARKGDTYPTMTCWLADKHKSLGNGEILGYDEHCKKRLDCCLSQTG